MPVFLDDRECLGASRRDVGTLQIDGLRGGIQHAPAPYPPTMKSKDSFETNWLRNSDVCLATSAIGRVGSESRVPGVLRKRRG